MESTGGPECGVSSLTNNVAAASLTNSCSHGTIAEYERMKGLKHGLTMKKKNFDFAAKQSNQEQLRSMYGKKKKKAELTRYR